MTTEKSAISFYFPESESESEARTIHGIFHFMDVEEFLDIHFLEYNFPLDVVVIFDDDSRETLEIYLEYTPDFTFIEKAADGD